MNGDGKYTPIRDTSFCKDLANSKWRWNVISEKHVLNERNAHIKA